MSEAPKYAQVLDRRQREAGAGRKGERTRNRLKLAAVEVLDEVGYRDMRVADICERAGIATPTFYLYFQNKTEITTDVLTEFLETIFHGETSERESRTAYQAIYATNLEWIGAVRANAGLMRCLLQLSDEIPEFKELQLRANHVWYKRVTAAIVRRFPAARLDEKVILLAVYAVGAMMDELSRKLLVLRDKQLRSLTNELLASDHELAEFLSLLWHRALYCADPPELKSAAAKSLVKLATLDEGGGRRAGGRRGTAKK